MSSNNPLAGAFVDVLMSAHPGYFRHYANVGTVGSAGSTLRMQYSTNGGVSYQFIDSETTNTGSPIAIDGLGLRISSFVKLDEAFLISPPPLMRVIGQGGNGAADPQFVLYGAETTEYDPSTY
jgi:hypothetical protein